MGDKSKIQWTDGTFSPWRGCTKVSEGCKNCYAEALITKRQGLPVWGQNAERKIAAESTWKNLARWNKQTARHPDKCLKCGLRTAGGHTDEDGNVCGGQVARNVPFSVFPSLCDVFEDYQGPSKSLIQQARDRYFRECETTPFLRHLLLTKRPENILKMIPTSWRDPATWPRNVWIGCTVENQERAEERIPHLLSVPAPVRFLSLEPLLEAIRLDFGRCETHNRDHVQVAGDDEFCSECSANGLSGELSFGHWLDYSETGINWVIVGGESGPGARPFNPAWVDLLVRACEEYGVPIFVKQMGSNPCMRDGSGWGPIKERKGGDMTEWPKQLRIREFPKAQFAADSQWRSPREIRRSGKGKEQGKAYS